MTFYRKEMQDVLDQKNKRQQSCQQHETDTQKFKSLEEDLKNNRSETAKSPDKGLFGKLFQSVKSAVDGWSNKYDTIKQFNAKQVNQEFVAFDQQDRNKVTIKKAREANTFVHDGKKINKMIDSLKDQIRFEEGSGDGGNFKTLLELKSQLKKWEEMKTQIDVQATDPQNPNAKRHAEVVSSTKNNVEILNKNLAENYIKLTQNGELSESEVAKFDELTTLSYETLERKSYETIQDSLSNFKAETLVFPTDENGKSVLTREVFEKYGNMTLRELFEIKNSMVEDPKIIDSIIIYRSRKPNKNLDEKDYDKWRDENRIPMNPTTLKYNKRTKKESFYTEPSQVKTPNESIWQQKVNFENGKKALNRLKELGSRIFDSNNKSQIKNGKLGEAMLSTWDQGIGLLTNITAGKVLEKLFGSSKTESKDLIITEERSNNIYELLTGSEIDNKTKKYIINKELDALQLREICNILSHSQVNALKTVFNNLGLSKDNLIKRD